MAPTAMASTAMTPTAMTPPAMASTAMAPTAMTPPAMAPPTMTPTAMTPPAMAPPAMAPTAMAPPPAATQIGPSMAEESSTPSIYPSLSEFDIDYELVNESWPVLESETMEIEDRDILINMDFANPKQIQACKNEYQTTFKYDQKLISMTISCDEKFQNVNLFKNHKETCLFRLGLIIIFHMMI